MFELEESMPWWGRPIIFIFIIPVIMPFSVYDQMPAIAIITTVIFQLLLGPLILYHSLWRRKVAIDKESRNVIVSSGPIVHCFRKEYPIDTFNKFEVEIKKESISGHNEEVYVGSPSSRIKVSETFMLKGNVDLELIEYSYSYTDLETKSLVQHKRDEISYFLLEFFPSIEIG